jgi:hypothetical protein
MAGPIYVMWRGRAAATALQATEEEWESFAAKLKETDEKCGVKQVIRLDTYWSTEHWPQAGVAEFPSLEALQECERLKQGINFDRWIESEFVMLGTKMEEA